jgi:hypothetical protein
VLVTTLLQGAVVAWLLAHRIIPTPGENGDVFFVILATTAAFGLLAVKIARGRSDRSGLTLGLAFAPALVAELCGRFDLYEGRYISLIRMPAERMAAHALDAAAMERLVGCATSAVAFVLVAVSCTSFVLTAAPRDLAARDASHVPRGTPSLFFGGVLAAGAILGAASFVFLRLRDTHRDGLGGALPVLAIAAGTVLAPILARRAQRVATWHDDREVCAVNRAALFAVVAIGLAGLATERAVMAYDEHLALAALRDGLGFEARLELTHTLFTTWQAHSLAAIVVGISILLPIVLISRTSLKSLGGPGADAIAPLLALGIVVAVGFAARRHENDALAAVPLFDDDGAVAHGVHLPRAPNGRRSHFSGEMVQVRIDREGQFAPPWAAHAPFLVVADRTISTTALLRAAIELRAEEVRTSMLLVEGAPAEAMVDLGRARPLAGPRTSTLSLQIANEPESMTQWNRVLLVLDDGEVARIVLRHREGGRIQQDTPRGTSLRGDPESRARRHALADEIGAPEAVLLGPHPAGDAQALVDAIVATHELGPRATVLLTTDRDAIERAILGR